MKLSQALLILLLCLFAAGLASADEETVAVDLGWAACPIEDENGDPLACAVRYRLYSTRDGGQEQLLTEVYNDTTCCVDLDRGFTYLVRVIGYDAAGRASVPSEWSDPIYFEPDGGLTGVDDVPASGARIESTYPNPFNPVVRIAFALGRDEDGTQVRLDVVDLRGRTVRTLTSESMPAGRHEVTWTGDDDSGRQMPSGTYILRLSAGSHVHVQRVTMVK